MTTITANILERVTSFKTFPARVEIFTTDELGRWSGEGIGPMKEYEVIEVCKKASNWKEIKANHFRMDGFHS